MRVQAVSEYRAPITFRGRVLILVFERMGLLEQDETTGLLALCDKLSRMITNFTHTLH